MKTIDSFSASISPISTGYLGRLIITKENGSYVDDNGNTFTAPTREEIIDLMGEYLKKYEKQTNN